MDRSRPGVRAMADLVATLGDQLRASFAATRALDLPRFDGVRRVRIYGMGGSAAAAEVLAATLADGRFEVSIVRGYQPSVPATDDTLHVFSSYSGATEETRSCFEHVTAAHASIRAVAMGSGGPLAEAAEAAGMPLLAVPGGLPPRASLGHGVGCLAGLVAHVGLAPDVESDVAAAADRLDAGVEALALREGASPALEEWTARLAGRLPVVYAGAPVSIAAMRRLRAQFNENAKMLVATAELPELDHNEIVGWGHATAARDEMVVVALRDPAEHPRVARRFAVTRDVLADRVPAWFENAPADGPALARAFESIQWADALSVSLAAAHGVDPMPVAAIDTLKDRLRGG